MSELAIDHEQQLLGCVLYGETASDAVASVRPEHFFEPAHGRLWAAMQAQAVDCGLYDITALASRMKQDAALEALGGVRYLADLVDQAPPTHLAEHLAGQVIDHAGRRACAQLGKDLADEAGKELPTETLIAKAEAELARIARDGGRKALSEAAGLTAADMLERAWNGELKGAPVGVDCLDRVTNGVRPGDVWVIGGRSSMGKSVVALSLARGIAEQGRGVLFFSLEMPLREVQCRLIADMAYNPERIYDDANIGYGDLLKGKGDARARDRSRAAARRLASLPINVIDVGGLTIQDIRSQAQRQLRAWEKAGVPIGAVVIDHLGLVKAEGQRRDSKAAETADIVNELKSIAKALKSPLICLAQVNRGPEGRDNKRPTMADLNWSGSIEQIADFVCLLYREAYYLSRSPDPDDEMKAIAAAHDIELIVAKNRSGPIFTVKAWIDVASNAVRDLPERDRRFG